ncbi:MAG: hypothetical protein AAGC88_12890 [Bacteroidota bacterium]
MERILILIVLALSYNCGQSQNSDGLYLISGHPYDNTDKDFASYLWQYTGSSLDTVLLLSTKADFLENVKVYPDQDLAIMHKVNSIKRRHLGDNHRLVFLDFKSSLEVEEIQFGQEGLLRFYLSARANDKVVCYLFNKENDKPRQFLNIDRYKREVKKDSIESFKFSVLTGEFGGAIDAQDHLIVYSDKESGFLEIPFHGDRSRRPKFPYEMPFEDRFGKYARQLVPINNQKIFVVAGNRQLGKEDLGTYDLKILQKENNQWHKKQLKGDLLKVRGFEEWVGGYVFNEPLEDRELPGSEEWTNRESGLSPAERWGLLNKNQEPAYALGILYIYNTVTKQYYEWNTNQADSEVILIWKSKVIYRSYDQLYQADIREDGQLGLTNKQLLVEGDVVPDIHWAFFSGN